MTVTPDTSRVPSARWRPSYPVVAWERTIRLSAGLVLFAFVSLHLVNHALGIFGLRILELVQDWRIGLWQNPIGTVVLYGAFAAHAVLALKRLATRRTLRIPPKELLQVGLGLVIPLLLIRHAAGTRYMAEFHGVDESYGSVLHRLWPNAALQQTALVLVAWTHGVLGIHYAFRARRWPRTIRFAGLATAILLPGLALAGFVAASREALMSSALPGGSPNEMQELALERVISIGMSASTLALALVGVLFAWRAFAQHRGNRITIRYKGHGEVGAHIGATLLEISRLNRIPHPSICGGRGRCATCRVLVLEGGESLPEPEVTERALLERISAPPGVRLGCRIKPRTDLSVQILLPVGNAERLDHDQQDEVGWGVEKSVTALVVDMRAFTALARKHLPYELVVLLNRFLEEMTQAVKAHGGRVDLFVVDGLTAIFRKDSDGGSRDALRAARDMLKSVSALNGEFKNALSLPLRAGIGIHTGHALMARIGNGERPPVLMALGETVAVASRLEGLSKELLADLIISKETAAAAGLDTSRLAPREVSINVLDRPLTIFPIQRCEDLASTLR